MALLDVRNVTMKFGELVANDRVSFTVEAGSIVGLIGPNGAGKTTLFNCISGLFKPTGGSIIFDGEDITGLTTLSRLPARERCAPFRWCVPLKEMTVFDNVLVGAFLKCSGKTRGLREGCGMYPSCAAWSRFRKNRPGDCPSVGKSGSRWPARPGNTP